MMCALLTDLCRSTHGFQPVGTAHNAAAQLNRQPRDRWRRCMCDRLSKLALDRARARESAMRAEAERGNALESMGPNPPALLIAQAKRHPERTMSTGAEYCSTTLMLSIPRMMMPTWTAQKK